MRKKHKYMEPECTIWIDVRRDKAYVPTAIRLTYPIKRRTLEGPKDDINRTGVLTEPVYSAPLTVDGLAALLEEALARGNPTIHLASPDEMYGHFPDPMPKAMGVRTSRGALRGTIPYSVQCYGDELELGIPPRKPPYDTGGSVKRFPREKSARAIAEAILADLVGRRGVVVQAIDQGVEHGAGLAEES